ncbi:MAG: glycosyltransferase [Burkholderiaceae bacterium]
MNNDDLSSSFVLCSKDGGQRLLRCLERIEALDAPPDFEIVLVDNGSKDGSFDAMRRHAASSRFRASAHQTFVPGNSAGRNLALSHAGGDVVVFIDDDCYVDRAMVLEWLEVFRRHPGIGYASGRIEPFDAANSMLGCNVSDKTALFAPRRFVRRGLIQGSNMAFRRRCLDEAGWFDARFGAGTRYAGEEWDVALRASFRGWGGGYFPGPVVAHDHGRKDDDARERLLFYDYGAGAVYAKNLFRKGGLTVAKEFYYEAKVMNVDIERRKKLVQGCRDYLLAAA